VPSASLKAAIPAGTKLKIRITNLWSDNNVRWGYSSVNGWSVPTPVANYQEFVAYGPIVADLQFHFSFLTKNGAAKIEYFLNNDTKPYFTKVMDWDVP
jgi:hypothetical protein